MGTNTKYKDVLIGRRTDPFCFKFFPENNSSGVECYRAEDGIVKYYDINREAVRTDYNVKMNGAFGLFGNITSTVTHVGKYMWIINKLWLGLDQCICTDPGRDKCSQAPNCSSYAWHYNFAEDAQYLGRERIGVAWNGVQIYDPSGWTDTVEDPSVFEAPPRMCKKGGAKIRIKCDDEGNFHPDKNEGLHHLDQLRSMAALSAF